MKQLLKIALFSMVGLFGVVMNWSCQATSNPNALTIQQALATAVIGFPTYTHTCVLTATPTPTETPGGPTDTITPTPSAPTPTITPCP